MGEKVLAGDRALLSGASGMLGTALGKALKNQGIATLKLVRREPRSGNEISWNPASGNESTFDDAFGIAEISRLEGLTAAVHLSGANVSGRRWSEAYKREMYESRVTSTRVLSEALARLKRPPGVLVSASAVGFYGNRGDEVLNEDSAIGKGFFPGLCAAWEAAARPAADAGIRVVHLRFGMVIGPDGGAMARLVPVFRLGIGGNLGNGRQWMSWISEADAVGAALFALGVGAGADSRHPLPEQIVSGPVNAVAPEPVTNAAFTRELGHAVHRPAVLPVPRFALRLLFGEMADEALLASSRVVPKRLIEAGYVFQYPTLSEAFAASLKP